MSTIAPSSADRAREIAGFLGMALRVAAAAALASFVVFHLVQTKRALDEQDFLHDQNAQLKAQHEALKAQQQALARRYRALDPDEPNLDVLESILRAEMKYTAKDELVIPLAPDGDNYSDN